MSASSPATPATNSAGFSVALSGLMIFAGLLAVILPQVAGIAVSLLVAWLLIFSGIAHLAFAWHTHEHGGAIWEFLVGILYIAIGVYILINPVAGLASITFWLAIYLFVKAVLEFAMGLKLRPRPGSGWLLFDGIVTLVLAVLIWRTWPSSSEWVVGTLVGISMLFSGSSRLMLSLAARGVVKAPAA